MKYPYRRYVDYIWRWGVCMNMLRNVQMWKCLRFYKVRDSENGFIGVKVIVLEHCYDYHLGRVRTTKYHMMTMFVDGTMLYDKDAMGHITWHWNTKYAIRIMIEAEFKLLQQDVVHEGQRMALYRRNKIVGTGVASRNFSDYLQNR